MRLPRKPFLYTLVASLLLHLALLLGPTINLPQPKPPAPLSVVINEAARPKLEPLRLKARPHPPKARPPKHRAVPPEASQSVTALVAAVEQVKPLAPAEPVPPPIVSEAAPTAVSAVAATEPPVSPSPIKKTLPSVAEATAAVAQREFPAQIRLVFNVYRGTQGLLLGKTTHLWRVVNNDYSITSTTEATGLFSLFFHGKYFMSSVGKLTDAGLQPSAFSVQRGQADRSEVANFDWQAKTLEYGKATELQRADLADGTQDQLSGMYQLALTAPHHGRVQVALTTGRKLNRYEYEVVGNETVETPLGKFKSEHISSVKQAQDEDTGDIWLAIEQHYLPVRFKLTTRDGEVLDHLLAEVRISPAEQP